MAKPHRLPVAFHVVAKPAGAACNLACDYCFYLKKRELYPGSRCRMSDEVLDAYLQQVIEAQQTSDVVIGWQGGEPTLMGIGFFERALEIANRYTRPGLKIHHAIQTNGVLLDDSWCRFFKRHGFLVGLSIDGPPELHDVYRKDKQGNPSSSWVVSAAKALRRHGVSTNLLVSVHAGNASHPLHVYRYLRSLFEECHLQFIPIVERVSGGSVSPRSVSPTQWGQFLIAVFDEWVHKDVGKVFVQLFEATFAAWVDAPPTLCIFSETCGRALVLEHNGDLYSCDHFVEPPHLLGNICSLPLVAMVASDQQREFGRNKRSLLSIQCRGCDWLFICHGECPANRFVVGPDGKANHNYLCAGYERFFRHSARTMNEMATLLAKGRRPSDIMREGSGRSG